MAINVISTIDPAGTGTRIEIPSNNPFNTGNASVTAIAAPVELGTMLQAAARPSLRSFLLGPSTNDWLAVYPWTVFNIAFSIPIDSWSMEISGDAAFVVQDAFDVISQVPNLSSFTPNNIVSPCIEPSPPFDGAEITTFLAPQSMWNFALSYEVKSPVASTTTSILKSFQGSFVVSFSEINFITFPLATKLLSFISTVWFQFL